MHLYRPHADSCAARNEGTGTEAGQRTSQAAAPSWAAICCHRPCPPGGGPFHEVFSRSQSVAICLARHCIPTLSPRAPDPGSGSDPPAGEGPRSHPRHLPFDADSHIPYPPSRGGKPVFYHLLSDRNTQGFPGAQVIKNLPAMQEIWVQSLGREDPLEKEMAAHSIILVWRIPWTEEPGGLHSIGSQRVRHNRVTNTHTGIHRLSLL